MYVFVLVWSSWETEECADIDGKDIHSGPEPQRSYPADFVRIMINRYISSSCVFLNIYGGWRRDIHIQTPKFSNKKRRRFFFLKKGGDVEVDLLLLSWLSILILRWKQRDQRDADAVATKCNSSLCVYIETHGIFYSSCFSDLKCSGGE